jgi:hypothetical protein
MFFVIATSDCTKSPQSRDFENGGPGRQNIKSFPKSDRQTPFFGHYGLEDPVHLFRFFIFFVILDTTWICLRNSQKITDIP